MEQDNDTAIRDEIVKQGRVALEALKKHKEAKAGEKRGKKSLFPEQEESVFFAAKYKRIPLKRSPVHRRFVALPHSDKNPTNTSICLILPDLDRSVEAKRDPEVDKQAKEWDKVLKQKFNLEGVDVAKAVLQIFTYTQLAREYSQHPDKAKLSNTYDLFLVDTKIMPIVFSLLGQSFKRPGKMPFPVHADRPSLANEIMRAYGLVNLSLEAMKDTVSVRIGNLSQNVDELTANLGAVIDKLLLHAPGGEKNIRACHVHLSQTETTLPIYVDFGSANEVSLPESRKRAYPTVKDECSTLPDGLSVRVSADGTVVVIDEKTQEEVIYPTLDDEWEPEDDLKPRQRDIDTEVKERAKKALRETTTAARKHKRPPSKSGVKKRMRSALKKTPTRKRQRPSSNAD